MTEVVDNLTGELVPYDDPTPGGIRSAGTTMDLFGSGDPQDVIRRSAEIADALVGVINEKKLYTVIRGRKYPHVQAWTLLGSMVGVFPIITWTRQITDGWEARCEVKTRFGELVGAAEAMCTSNERNWGPDDNSENDRRAMAQTRAISRAMRAPLGYIVQLAGLDPGDPSNAPASREQHALLAVTIKEIEDKGVSAPDGYSDWTDYSRAAAGEMFGVTSRAQLTVAQMSELINYMQTADVPF